jgi:hypothetical protein
MAKKGKGGKKTGSGQYDLFAGRRRRDDGMKLVADNNPTFSYQFFHYILALPIGWIGNCESISKVWTGVQPKHHNAWGSCWGHAKKKGLLRELVTRVPNTNVKSNARRQNLYERVAPSQAI